MDSKMDVDMGKLPEPHRLSPATEPASIPTLDGWIESLMNCKQLAENDVQRLCDRVCLKRLIWKQNPQGFRRLKRNGLGSRSAAGRVQCTASGMKSKKTRPFPILSFVLRSCNRNAQLQYAVTSTANFTTSWSSSRLEAQILIPTTFSWVRARPSERFCILTP